MFHSMKVLLATASVALIAAAASAQYKTPPTTKPDNVQVQGNNSLQITPAPQGEDDLAKARRINREEAMKMVKAKKAVYVDVRGKDAYDASHIPGALNIPLGELMTRLKELPPRKFIITYCA